MRNLGIAAAAVALLPLTQQARAADNDAALKAQVEALTKQLQKVSEQSQRQIQTLQQQVQALVTRLDAQPATTPPRGIPDPDARNVVVTQQPGNLPGRGNVPPYTSSSSGTPGGIPPVIAAPISSGSDRVKISLSGQVNRALLAGDDGHDSNLRNVDNNNSSTRVRIVGEGRISPGTVGGVNIETEIRPNSSATITLTQDAPQSASNVTFTARQVEAYVASPQYGGARLGFGSTASYLTSEVDLSGTSVASYSEISDLNGGFAFRQKSAAAIPAGAGGAFIASPANAFGPAVGSVFDDFDGLGRSDRIRFDSAMYRGFQLAVSFVDGGAYDIALRSAFRLPGWQFAGSLAYADASSRDHTPVSNYGYAGVPAGAGGTSAGGTNASPNSPFISDTSANASTQFDGSISALHVASGLSFTLAGGSRAPKYRDPLGASLSPDFVFAKLGWQSKLWPLGVSAFSIDFAQNDDIIFAGDVARAYSLAYVQNWDDAGTEFYATYRRETLTRRFGTFYPIDAILAGARVRF